MKPKKLLLLSTMFVVWASLPGYRPALATELMVLDLRPELLHRQMPPASEARLTRDPFNWPAAQMGKLQAAEETRSAAEVFQGIVLSGIIWDDKRPLAFINGHLTAVGDQVNLARVAEITKNEVVLEYHGVRHVIQFDAKPTGLQPGLSR